MSNSPQQVAETVVSVTSAGGAWIAWLSSANEILITVATLIAIVSGGLALRDRYRKRNK